MQKGCKAYPEISSKKWYHIRFPIEARSAENLRTGTGDPILDLFSHKVYVPNNFI